MRQEEAGKRVVEVAGGLVTHTERTIPYDIRPVSKVQAPCVQTRNPRSQQLILCHKGTATHSGKTSKKDIVGGLKAGGGDLEDVFWAEVRQGGDEGEDGGHEEDVEGVGDGSW